MKLILVYALALVILPSTAFSEVSEKIYCSLMTSIDGQAINTPLFKNLVVLENSSEQYIVVKKDGHVIEQFDPSSPLGETIASFHEATFVNLSLQKDRNFIMGLGRIEVANGHMLMRLRLIGRAPAPVLTLIDLEGLKYLSCK